MIYVDSNKYEKLIELMDDYKMYHDRAWGHNKDGEQVSISVNKDNVVVETFQNNGWLRQDWYWRDGTQEEVFEGRWKEVI